MVLAPFFEKPPSLIQAPDGSILFECICNANPQPTIKWYFKGKELTGDRYVMKIKKMVGKWTVTMNMKNPTQDDQGVYKVEATNEKGQHAVEQQYVFKQTGKEVFKTQMD
ncbi:hypothetical protein WR25_00011 [Diploscapter pachys]|uniref:Ig-like domain-containing protein n=1 Tax=Diploscapter pachys TaxID=2018661 RepID=A0A2A2KDX9_9BILA|nr:hypothetical protein WR25_00011 [Diploscapter pachys]